MSYMTAMKRARGHGSAREGTRRHWAMTKSSVALILILPFFVFIFGPLLGQPHDAVIATLSRPFPAIVIGLMVVVGFLHFKTGIQAVIEDYSHGAIREYLIILTTCLSYGAMAMGLFAIAKIAL